MILAPLSLLLPSLDGFCLPFPLALKLIAEYPFCHSSRSAPAQAAEDLKRAERIGQIEVQFWKAVPAGYGEIKYRHESEVVTKTLDADAAEAEDISHLTV